MALLPCFAGQFSAFARATRRMSRLAALFVLLATAPFLAAPALSAQTDMPTAPVIAQAPVPVVDASDLKRPSSFDQGWLVESGDNPAWADPSFDDSQWKRFNAHTDSLHTLFPHQRPEVVWYRIHLKVSPKDKGLAFLEWYVASAFEIYANGEKLLQLGSVSPFEPYEANPYLLRRVPGGQVANGSLVIAVRCHISSSEWLNAWPGFYYYNLIFGQEPVLRDLMWLEVIGGRALTFLDYLLDLAMLAGAILLYSAQRRREYLFLALAYGFLVVNLPLFLYTAFHTYPSWWHILNSLVSLLSPWLITRTYVAFAGRSMTLWLNLLAILAGLANCASATLTWLSVSNSALELLLSLPILALIAVAVPSVLIGEARRGNRDAGILVVPLLLTVAQQLLFFFFFALSQVPVFRVWAWNTGQKITTLSLPPFSLGWNTMFNMLATLSLALIILLRSNRQSRQQAVLETELANAREVQRVILPEATASNPGFHVESVYEPAQEVGGDFFQVLDDGAGGLLVVVGDVAGKGLPAAMLVSVLVGAIHSVASYTKEPAEMLAQLNERLQGRTQGGFSTAIAAHIAADGTVRIANAGHLPPYLDGRELELPGALPLGIDDKAEFETRTVALAAGSRLTFYSDGVPEARNAGGELLGFERAKLLATKPASEIAETAKSFGQSDDITVVTIARAAAIATAA